MENRIKKLFTCTIVSFALIIAVWLVICLEIGVNSKYGSILGAVSLIPCACYVVCGTKSLDVLGIKNFYSIL